MQATFYGVRGSIPSPGQHTVRYGGNTSCMKLAFGQDDYIVIDAGSGLRNLGNLLAADDSEIHLFLTHNHWDHVMGFPFFAPAYQAQRKINIYTDWPGAAPLLEQMRAPFFPVEHEQLRSDISVIKTHSGLRLEPLPGLQVGFQALNHPNGGCALRLEADGKCLVFATDNELNPPGEPQTSWEQWLAFIDNCDLLIHDANYTRAEHSSRMGWGHSAFEDAVQLACEAGVGALALYHHDIDRSDAALDQIGETAQSIAGGRTQIIVAREGQTIAV